MTNVRGKPQKGRLADMTVHPPPEKVWEPYRDGLPEDTTVDLGECRIQHRLWFDGTLLSDFVLLLQVPVGDDADDEEWEDILRVDCCHQEVHAHRLYSSDPDAVYKVLKPIRAPEDLQEGADLAEALVYDERDEHLRRVGR